MEPKDTFLQAKRFWAYAERYPEDAAEFKQAGDSLLDKAWEDFISQCKILVSQEVAS